MLDDLLNLVTLLFFLSSVPLTSAPVDIVGEVEIVISDPVKAVNKGAFLAIDVSKDSRIHKLRITQVKKAILEWYPFGTIVARLYSDDGAAVELKYSSMAIFAEDGISKARLKLTNSSGMPLGMKFVRFSIESEHDLQDVDIFWINGAK